MLRILIFNWRDKKNPLGGGAEVYTHEIFSRIANKYGKQVTLFTSAFPSCDEDEHLGNMRIIRSGNRYSVYSEAKKYFKEHFSEYDIVIDEINTRPFMTPTYVKTCPVMAIIHQLAREYWWSEAYFPLSAIGYYYLEPHWLKQYTNTPTVTVSESTVQDLRKLGFHRLAVVQNGRPIDSPQMVPKKSEIFTLVFLARFTKMKRPKDAIQAYEKASKKLDCKLIMIGDGKLRKNLLREYGGRVEFVDRAGDGEKLEILASAKLHLAPYVREGWANTVIEAASVGTPTIGYNTHGLMDSIRNGSTGFLVPKFDVQDMANKIEYLISNPNILDGMAKACFQWSRNFSWEKSADEFNGLVEQEVKNWRQGKSPAPRIT